MCTKDYRACFQVGDYILLTSFLKILCLPKSAHADENVTELVWHAC